jgi:hypothetical protein
MLEQPDVVLFQYPETLHVRRHGPSGYQNYVSYKPWLRDEFTFQCVYCLCRERWFPDSETAFSIDHLHPQLSAPERRTEYDNLLYACCQCNSVRGASPVPDPCEYAYGQLLRVLEDGFVEALTSSGHELIEICRLNRPHLVTFRRGMMDVIATLHQRKDGSAEELMRHYLGFPVSLPNLALLRPPTGNSRPSGIDHSYCAQRSRGELPDTY